MKHAEITSYWGKKILDINTHIGDRDFRIAKEDHSRMSRELCNGKTHACFRCGEKPHEPTEC